MKNYTKYQDKDIIDAIASSLSISDVCRWVGVSPKGGSFERVKNKIKELNLDTSHFLGKAAKAGKNNPCYADRKDKKEILVENVPNRISHKMLKRAMLESGIEYKCNTCGIFEWNSMSLTLDIDHINGDWSDCKLNNLRFLCPNCHRQTDTFAGKNIK